VGAGVRALRVVGLVAVVLIAASCVPSSPSGPGTTIGAPSAGDPYTPRSGNGGYDVRHYDLAVRYDPATDVLFGVATIRARATQLLSQFDLDLVGLTVRAVTVNGDAAAWSRSGNELVIRPHHLLRRRDAFLVHVRYDGVPEPVPSSLGGGGFMATDDGAVVAGQPDVAATWYPVNDHPSDAASYTYRVTVPDRVDVVANGLPVRTVRSGAWTTHVWQTPSPMASYLSTIDVGHWNWRVRSGPHGLPIIDAVDPEIDAAGRAQVDAALAREPDMLTFLEGLFGPYPFETAGAIVDSSFFPFALETQTRPTYPALFFQIGQGETVVVHELAHQWTGDSVRLARWRDIWLNEGFATYVEWLWSQHNGGARPQDFFDDLYAQSASEPFWQLKIGDPGFARMFDDAVYQRGAMTLHALRLTIGDRDFFRLVRRWTALHAGDAVTTPQFIHLAERISGQDLDAFFRAWLYTGTKPAAPAGVAAESAAASASVRAWRAGFALRHQR
jgi:aminopeptidase N